LLYEGREVAAKLRRDEDDGKREDGGCNRI